MDLALLGLTPSNRDLDREPHRKRVGGRGECPHVGGLGGNPNKRFNTFSEAKIERFPKKLEEKMKLAKKVYPPSK